jgi:PadR family transcriptional regulator AphA
VQTRPLLPGEYAVLGLLLSGAKHGYEMARYFEREELSEVCPIEQSLLYTYLRNVEERGLVEWSEVRVGNRPPRKLFELSRHGRDLIESWLDAPVERLRDVRLDFLLKLYFLRELDAGRERALVDAQIEACSRYFERLETRERDARGFARLVAASKRSGAESTLRWLREYAWELKHHEGAIRA